MFIDKTPKYTLNRPPPRGKRLTSRQCNQVAKSEVICVFCGIAGVPDGAVGLAGEPVVVGKRGDDGERGEQRGVETGVQPIVTNVTD